MYVPCIFVGINPRVTSCHVLYLYRATIPVSDDCCNDNVNTDAGPYFRQKFTLDCKNLLKILVVLDAIAKFLFLGNFSFSGQNRHLKLFFGHVFSIDHCKVLNHCRIIQNLPKKKSKISVASSTPISIPF